MPILGTYEHVHEMNVQWKSITDTPMDIYKGISVLCHGKYIAMYHELDDQYTFITNSPMEIHCMSLGSNICLVLR